MFPPLFADFQSNQTVTSILQRWLQCLFFFSHIITNQWIYTAVDWSNWRVHGGGFAGCVQALMPTDYRVQDGGHITPMADSCQFSSVAQSCPTLCDPMNHSTPGFPVHHQLPEPTQTHVH